MIRDPLASLPPSEQGGQLNTTDARIVKAHASDVTQGEPEKARQGNGQGGIRGAPGGKQPTEVGIR